MLAAVDDAEASLAGRPGTPRGLLSLTVPDAFGRLVVLPLLQKYLATWPNVQVEVSFTDRPADIVEDGFDLTVRVGEASPDTRLVSRVVAKYKARAVRRAVLSGPGEVSRRVSMKSPVTTA